MTKVNAVLKPSHAERRRALNQKFAKSAVSFHAARMNFASPGERYLTKITGLALADADCIAKDLDCRAQARPSFICEHREGGRTNTPHL